MKPFSDIGEQLRILQEDKKLLIQDMDNAIFALMNCGYYEIVNGYKLFLLDPNMVIFDNKNGHGYLNFCLYKIIEHEKNYPSDLEILEKQMGFPQGRLYNELEKLRQTINLHKLINDKN